MQRDSFDWEHENKVVLSLDACLLMPNKRQKMGMFSRAKMFFFSVREQSEESRGFSAKQQDPSTQHDCVFYFFQAFLNVRAVFVPFDLKYFALF